MSKITFKKVEVSGNRVTGLFNLRSGLFSNEKKHFTEEQLATIIPNHENNPSNYQALLRGFRAVRAVKEDNGIPLAFEKDNFS